MAIAVVIGGSGAIGSALVTTIEKSGQYESVLAFSRCSGSFIDITSDDSVREAANSVAACKQEVRLIITTVGILHSESMLPEKSLEMISDENLSRYFSINAIGPMLVMKYFLPLLPKTGKSVFACLSARVGSIADNHLGGWYGYRASKAALNQFVRTASIEIKRTKPDAICVALHPGTVSSRLSAPFRKQNLNINTSEQAAQNLTNLFADLSSADSGQFLDLTGLRLPW